MAGLAKAVDILSNKCKKSIELIRWSYSLLNVFVLGNNLKRQFFSIGRACLIYFLHEKDFTFWTLWLLCSGFHFMVCRPEVEEAIFYERLRLLSHRGRIRPCSVLEKRTRIKINWMNLVCWSKIRISCWSGSCYHQKRILNQPVFLCQSSLMRKICRAQNKGCLSVSVEDLLSTAVEPPKVHESLNDQLDRLSKAFDAVQRYLEQVRDAGIRRRFLKEFLPVWAMWGVQLWRISEGFLPQ